MPNQNEDFHFYKNLLRSLTVVPILHSLNLKEIKTNWYKKKKERQEKKTRVSTRDEMTFSSFRLLDGLPEACMLDEIARHLPV